LKIKLRLHGIRWLLSIALLQSSVSIADSGLTLKQGDRSYPAMTPNPQIFVPITVSSAEWIDMKLVAVYVSDTSAFCGQLNIAAGHFPNDVVVPIEMTRMGDEYRGKIVVDRFEPGRCNWKFLGVEYGGWADDVWNFLATFREGDVSSVDQEPTVEFWCYHVNYKDIPRRNCEELALLKGSNAVRAVSPQFLSSFTVAQKAPRKIIYVTSTTKSVHVVLHDVNAIQGALIPVGDREAQIARAKADQDALHETPDYKAYMCVQPALGAYIRSHQPLPDTATQTAALREIKRQCRAQYGLLPEDDGR
jgi:hypothetical protein